MHDFPEQGDRDRRRRRHGRAGRRQVLLQRIGAVSVLGIAIAVVLAIVLTAVGGSGGAGDATRTASTHHAHRHHSPPQAKTPPAAGPHSTAAALKPGDGTPGNATVPILVYHVINVPPAGSSDPDLYVSAPAFDAQMEALKDAGWVAVTLDQLWANWTTGAQLPSGKPLVLTFDNGYYSQYSTALPELDKLHWVGDENLQLEGLTPSDGGLTDNQVRALVKAGWELDTQGVGTTDIGTLSSTELAAKVKSDRGTVQQRFDVPVNWFSYPSGQYDATVAAALKAAGYRGSTTVTPGWASRSGDPFQLPRLRIVGSTSPEDLLSQIAAAQSDPVPTSTDTSTTAG